MILVHRLKGDPVFVNTDLIESIESCPDTILTLVNGRKVVVADTPDDLVERIRSFRASVLVAADELRDGGGAPQLTVVGDDED